jgi:hypothetical protein
VLKYDWTKETQEVWRLEDKLHSEAVCHQFNLHSEYPTNEALEGSGDFKIGQVICTVKYAMTLCFWLRKEWC